MSPSVDYVALSESLARRDCVLGLSVGPRRTRAKNEQYRELESLTVRRAGDREVVASEPIQGDDWNGAASRLLARLR